MKTLIIAPFSPYPPDFGGAIRLYHLIKMFASISDVTLIAYATHPDKQATVEHLRALGADVTLVDEHPLLTHKKWWLQARATLSFNTFQYFSHYSQRLQHEIDALSQRRQFDCVVMENSQMGYFTYRRPGALRILDMQNIEYELLARRAAVESHMAKKVALALEARKFARAEMAICKRFDLIFTPSEREAVLLRQQVTPVQVRCLPNSIDPDYFAPRAELPGHNEIAFIGATHVDANRDGLCYFMAEVFPLIEQQVPDIHFTIVGGDPPPVIRQFGQHPHVEVTGYVKDVRPYMARARALVVPLRSGGGTRLKILEGLSFGVPMVSTSIGAEGIEMVDGEHLLLADNAHEFAHKVVMLLQDIELQRRIGAAGRRLVEQAYSWRAVGEHLNHYLRDAFNNRPTPPPTGLEWKRG